MTNSIRKALAKKKSASSQRKSSFQTLNSSLEKSIVAENKKGLESETKSKMKETGINTESHINQNYMSNFFI
jgi:hypothetical protein